MHDGLPWWDSMTVGNKSRAARSMLQPIRPSRAIPGKTVEEVGKRRPQENLIGGMNFT